MAKTFESIIDPRLAIFTKETTLSRTHNMEVLDHNTIDAFYPLISHIQTQKAQDKIVNYIMCDFETIYPSVSRPQLHLTLHDHGIQGTVMSVMKNFTKEYYVRVLYPHLPIDDYVEIERGLAGSSTLSPRQYSMFLNTTLSPQHNTESSTLSPRQYSMFLSLLYKLPAQFPGTTCARRQSPQWKGALKYLDDLCLCADSISELEDMISCAQAWAQDHA